MTELARILKERNETYGDFAAESELADMLQTVLRNSAITKWDGLESYKRQAIRMICVKLARIINGDSHHADSWADIAGYAQVAKGVIERSGR